MVEEFLAVIVGVCGVGKIKGSILARLFTVLRRIKIFVPVGGRLGINLVILGVVCSWLRYEMED